MHADAVPTLMQPQWFPLVFAGMWFGIGALISVTGGWSTLAQEFRATGESVGDQFRFVSGSMGVKYFPASYGGCLFVTVSNTGIRLSILFLFRFMSPPLFIPWSRVESVVRERFLFTERSVMRIRGAWPIVSLRGSAGRRVEEAYRVALRTAL